MAKKMEKRYRVIGWATMWHDLCKAHVEPGEDYNMTATYPDGRKWRYPDDIQKYLDSGQMEIYFAPVGTPHVVHSRGEIEHVDPETGKHSRLTLYTSAANQWAGETSFIEMFVADETAEKE